MSFGRLQLCPTRPSPAVIIALVWIVLCLALLLLSAFAQPRAVEVFGLAGVSRLGGDEGWLGSAAAWGGAAVLPLIAKYAIDVDVQTAQLSRRIVSPDRFSIRRTLISPAFVRRWGAERVYGFAGGGIGAQIDQTHSSFRIFGGTPPEPTGTVEASNIDSAATFLGKTGIVISPIPKLLIRGDLLLAFRYVLPTVSLRLGVGYRF